MSGVGLLISLGMLILGIAWLAKPFMGAKRTENAMMRERQRERAQVAARYERAIMTVRDLDEDFQVGKLSQAVYDAERARWVEEGSMLLEALEKVSSSEKSKPAKARPNTQHVTDEDPVEQAIAAYTRAREQSRSK